MEGTFSRFQIKLMKRAANKNEKIRKNQFYFTVFVSNENFPFCEGVLDLPLKHSTAY